MQKKKMSHNQQKEYFQKVKDFDHETYNHQINLPVSWRVRIGLLIGNLIAGRKLNQVNQLLYFAQGRISALTEAEIILSLGAK